MPKINYEALTIMPKAPNRTDILRFFQSADAAAEYFGVGSSAVRQWPLNRPIPQVHILKMKVDNPEFFRGVSRKNVAALL